LPCGDEGCYGGFDCDHACGPKFCRPYEARIAEHTQCGTCCKTVGCGGGIRQWLHNKATHCRGCGEIYWGEWLSDPPDCCDPCDACGNFTGAGVCCDHGCGLGILCRLCHLFQGHRYCPGPCGCTDCGGIGCDSCGHDGWLERGVEVHSHGSVLDEDWEPRPAPPPTPGKPIHKADSLPSVKVGAIPPAARSGGRMSYLAPRP
jgi:hypothetical protein